MSDAGYQVAAVGDGREALDAVRATVPDLLVSDVMMPQLDGLSLVAALRSDPRTESVPVLLLSARAGQDASVEGLGSGADDYLVKPFAAVELLARVRANVELARLRTHQSRWRTALVDSLHEAFFVCDEDGAVIEINNAFGEVLGYGADGLPYTPPFPWWPDEATDPEARGEVLAAFADLLSEGHGTVTQPVRHRDGHRLWVTATFNQTRDPDTGRRVVVGTFRDVTAEHYAIQRDSALAVLSTTMNRATTLDEALSGALAEVKALWRARRVLAALFTGDEPTITSTDPPDAWADLPADDRRVLADLRGQPMLTPIDGTGAGILLEHPEGPLALWVDLGGQRPFTAEDQLLLSLLAGHLVQGLVRAHQIDQQRETAIALQRAILGPTSLPGGFAVRYEPATRRLEVGGDWYDVITLSDGRIGIVVGDCVGRGLKAASVMGQLRSACRALLLQDASPARALTALDHFAATVPGAACTTVFCGVLDPRTSRLVYSSAGHPPGILAHADGTTHLLDRGRSTPLAMRRPGARSEAESDVPVGATLLLYTDGLVERRGRSLTDGIGRAARVVHDHVDLPLDDLATEVMAELCPATGYDDDLALLLYRHHAPLDVTFPADPAQLASLRAALRGWLTRAQVGPAVIQDLLVATGEACTNAIEHGHRDNPGDPIHLRAELGLDTVRLTVADSGRWKVPARDDDGIRGRGTNLMRALTDHVTISHDASGTTVHMRRKTTR
ncbi:SpoIIE family protein phosphatase [Actinokineospora soli]|uniref:SpoIIE family protein phosphatase n=1 Tax=Actinokineospora soli TaxID=1048753 RepID=A0ABW2TRG7_9PSEU